MKTDIFREPEPASLNGAALDLDLDVDPAGLALRQADIAKLFGITRQRVCQMVSRGLISTRSNGRINPSQAAKELISTDVKTARAKVLVDIRRQIDTSNARAFRAEEEKRAALNLVSVLESKINTLSRRILENELIIDLASKSLISLGFNEKDIDDVFDKAITTALGADLDDLLEKADPDLIDLFNGNSAALYKGE
ncbi:hypothetical protein [Chromatium okenii]|jgi:hypothetical protein|uniref:hypothetical protein n=1 Tax=Chromatium okenii TaxID=61644 RepID=UPI0026F1FD6C|nr:hypothetical protein [Chromatium okenii]MBV5311043.1 hypothetical protein [Chromatium okenii]